jgi:hypothetical protein
MENIVQSIPYTVLVDEFYGFYRNDFGGLKFKEVYDKVNSSNKIKKLLSNAKRDRIRLGTDDYLLTIHSSSSFTFAKPETIFFASIMILSKWEDEVGTPNNISDDVYMNTMFFRLLSKCDKFKTHLTGGPNFFARLYSHLNKVFG